MSSMIQSIHYRIFLLFLKAFFLECIFHQSLFDTFLSPSFFPSLFYFLYVFWFLHSCYAIGFHVSHIHVGHAS